MKSEITIRDAAIEDCESLAAMIGALLTQHRTMVPGDLASALRRDGFGAAPRFEALIAERNGEGDIEGHVEGDVETLGMALYYAVYRPSLAGHGLLMEDLFVRPEARRLGVGRAFIRRIARLAKSRGCVYIEWLVEGGNRPAEAFYAATGAVMEEGKMVCQIDGDALDHLADEEGTP